MGLKIFLGLALLLFSFSAASQPTFPPSAMPTPKDGEFEIWTNNRRVLCSSHQGLVDWLKERHDEHRVLSAVPVEREGGASGFMFFASKNTWSAVEIVGKRACVIAHGSFWEYKPLQGRAL